MRYLAILLGGTLAACASHNAPPAASSDSVQAATDAPAAGPSFAPVSTDGESAAPADQSSSARQALNPGAPNAAAMPLEAAPPAPRPPVVAGSNQGDLEITQQIRSALVSDSSLSVTAKNVRIMTLNGKVTLRGTVKSDAELVAVGDAAKKVAGSAQVENYLEVAK